jgi:hypothetical protein
MEKRRARRHKKRLMIKFGIQDTNNLGFVEDISLSGVRVKTNTVFRPSTKLKLEISTDNPDEIMTAEGIVSWAKKVPLSMMRTQRCGMGITFLKKDQQLLQYLEERERNY